MRLCSIVVYMETTTTTREVLTYKEGSATYDLVCAWDVEYGKQVPAVERVRTASGVVYPACAKHAAMVKEQGK